MRTDWSNKGSHHISGSATSGDSEDELKKKVAQQSSAIGPQIGATFGSLRLSRALSRTWEYSLIARSGLFDVNWYSACNADVAVSGFDPLAHFLLFGAIEGRDPNPYFDVQGYVASYPEAAGHNPLVHYLQVGVHNRARPSAAFDPDFYLAHYSDVFKSGHEPLAHFLLHGRAEGRRALPPSPVTRPVEAADLHVIRPVGSLNAETALFVTHAPGGALKPHVRLHVAALRALGFSVVVVAALDSFDTPDLIEWGQHTDGLYLRSNEGFDFSAWAHLARTIPAIAEVQALLLVNDSIVGPLNEGDFDRLVARLRSSDSDLIGLTENKSPRIHIQSYFLYAKGRGVASLLDYLGNVVSHAEKEQVIEAYETRLLAFFDSRNLESEILFYIDSEFDVTIWFWRDLIEQGMPFIKVKVLRGHSGVDNSRWRDVLEQRGFDVSVAEAALEITAGSVHNAAYQWPNAAGRPPQFLKSLWCLWISYLRHRYWRGGKTLHPWNARRADKKSLASPDDIGARQFGTRATRQSVIDIVRVGFWRLKQKCMPRSFAADRTLVDNSGLFNESWYRSRYADLDGVRDVLGHYLKPRASGHRASGPDFDGGGYIALHPDIQRAGLNPLVHYLRYGRREGRSIGLPPRLQPRIISAIEQFRQIEPEIVLEHGFDRIDHIPVERSFISSNVIQIWLLIFADLKKPYDRIICVPELGLRRGADAAVVDALAIAPLSLGFDLVVVADRDARKDCDAVPADADLIVLSDYDDYLTPGERTQLLEMLFFSVMPAIVVNVNSRACWNAIERRGKALSTITAFHVFAFCTNDESDIDVNTIFYLSKCLPQLAAIWTDDENVSSGSISGYQVPPSLVSRIRLVSRTGFDTKTDPAIFLRDRE